jgi:hypothetical protein
MSESFTSPSKIYENPDLFSGIIAKGVTESNFEYPRMIHKLMGNFYQDWNTKLSDSLKEHAKLIDGRWMALFVKPDGYCYPIDVTEFIIN